MLLALTVLIASGKGAVAIAPVEIARMVSYALGIGAREGFTDQQWAVLASIRLPRVALAVLTGAGLGLTGAVMQGLFRNPLADPSLVGVSSGAALFAAGAIVLGTSHALQGFAVARPVLVPLCAFAGGLLAVLIVQRLATREGRTAMASMLLAGIAITALSEAGIGLFSSHFDRRAIAQHHLLASGQPGRRQLVDAGDHRAGRHHWTVTPVSPRCAARRVCTWRARSRPHRRRRATHEAHRRVLHRAGRRRPGIGDRSHLVHRAGRAARRAPDLRSRSSAAASGICTGRRHAGDRSRPCGANRAGPSGTSPGRLDRPDRGTAFPDPAAPAPELEQLMLEASAITVVRGGRKLLDGVSLTAEPGRVHVLIGENGAGKSTLLGVLSRDITPTAGEARLDGEAIGTFTPLQLARRRALLPQEQHVAFGYTALEIVLLGRYPHCGGAPRRADLDIARASLTRVDALHLSDRSITTLSGGERARVQLARVLAQLNDGAAQTARDPLLDEPTADLDLAHQHLVLELARDFAREQRVAVVAVLHDFNLALQYADQVLCLQRGRTVASGAPDAVLTEELLATAFGMRCALLAHPNAGHRVVVALGRNQDLR